MSQAVAGTEIRAENGVVARSQYGDRVHRPDPDAEEPRPACHDGTVDHAETYREVEIGAVTPHYRPCRNPGCFGEADRRPRHICANGVPGRPIRVQAFHVGVASAVFSATPVGNRQVAEILGVGDSRKRSVGRGLSDAKVAGWVRWDGSAKAYRAVSAPNDPLLGHICRGSVGELPTRTAAMHVAIVAAIGGETPITRAQVARVLDVDESELKTVGRGVQDARDAGWLASDDRAYRHDSGPLAAEIDRPDPHPGSGGGAGE